MLNSSFSRYTIVGGLSVAIDYGLLALFVSFLEINSQVSVAIAFIVSSIFNFIMNKSYTFKHRDNIVEVFVKYVIVIFGSLLITIIIVELALRFDVNIYLGKFYSLITVYIYGYFASKYFIYRK